MMLKVFEVAEESFRLLDGRGRDVGWIRGSAIGFGGFRTEKEAVAAATVGHGALAGHLHRSFAAPPAAADPAAPPPTGPSRPFTPASGSPAHGRPTDGELLVTVLGGRDLSFAVPLVLQRLEEDPLASAGWFPGDLLRGLLEVPASFWARQPRLYARFRECLRAGAITRRELPPDERAHFWTAVLPSPERAGVSGDREDRREPSSD